MIRKSVRLTLLFTAFFSFGFSEATYGFSLKDPEQIGFAVQAGSTYDPEPSFFFTQLSISALYDYEQIMPHKAPDELKFKLEYTIGGADISGGRLLTSGNFYALYYLTWLSTAGLRPYIEGGAGIVYSDFQVEGQGLRWNFNPQAGFGLEWNSKSGKSWFSAVHAYHISNGGLNSENRGINGILFQLGGFF